MNQKLLFEESKVNRFSLMVCWVFFILVLFKTYFLGTHGFTGLVVYGGILIFSTIIFYFKDSNKFLKYLLVLDMILIEIFLLYAQKGQVGNLFLWFAIIAITSIYLDKWITFFAVTISNLFIISHYVANPIYFFFEFSNDEAITLCVALFLTGIITLYYVEAVRRMIDQSQEGEAGAVKTSVKLREVIDDIKITSRVLDESIVKLRGDTNITRSEISQIASSIFQTGKSLEDQTANASETVNSLSAIENTIKEVSQYSKDMSESSDVAYQAADNGKQIMSKLVSQINAVSQTVKQSAKVIFELNDQSKEINDIATMIKAIADQINLLSLNAAIEAARAGEHGKGFAVVAEEVRKLADQTSRAVQNISTILEHTKQKISSVTQEINLGSQAVEDGIGITNSTFENFISISEKVNDIKDKAYKVLGSIRNLSSASMIAFDKIDAISSLSEESTANIEEIAASIETQRGKINDIEELTSELVDLSKKLKSVVVETT